MYKKTIILFTFFSLFTCMTLPSFALDTQNNISSGDAEITPITPSSAPSDYQLPYPGLLPDNFLYKLKTLRDKVIGFLISDPLKKSEFYILQADKRYNASLYLFRENAHKDDMVISTLSKADNYMEEAIGQLVLAKKQGEVTQEFTQKLLVSNKKHLEVVKDMEKNAADNVKKNLVQEEGRIAHISGEVTAELPNK